jgi:hypothetical protein
MIVHHDYHMARLRIARLEEENGWLRENPHMPTCGYKCDYGKVGDPEGCFCGEAEWQAKKPPVNTVGTSPSNASTADQRDPG